jgi:lactate permease
VSTLLALAPLLVVVALLATRRVTLLQAGVAALVTAVPVVIAALPAETPLGPFFLEQTLRGCWLAWHAVAVIWAGLFFYRALTTADVDVDAGAVPAEAFSHRALFSAVFLLGPFAESATGFGVGMIIAMTVILRLGIVGAPAILFGLFSHMLVPWGALGIGTGAGVAHVTPAELGVATAVLISPPLLLFLGIFWRTLAAAGHRPSRAEKLDDVAWIVLLVVSLILANRYLAVELSGLASAGGLLVVRFLRDRRPALADWLAAAGRGAPYLALSGILVASRTVPPVHDTLRSVLDFAPYTDMPDFAVFYNPSFWLVAVAGTGLVATGRSNRLGRVTVESLIGSWQPAAITVVFIALAIWLSSAGIAALLGERLYAALGPAAIVASPLFGAIAGFLTSSNTASNGMMIPVLVALGAHAGIAPAWMGAINNAVGSSMTMLSPIRIAMGAVLIGQPGAGTRVYRLAWPIGLVVVGSLMLEALALLILAGRAVRFVS